MPRELTAIEIDIIARAAHEANRAYCMLLGDDSHLYWDAAPEWQKESSRAGVIGVATNELNPEQSHASWMQLKLSQGWRRGPTKDPIQKLHPCLVPYADLPEEQRYKDVLYTVVVKAMIDGLWRRPA